MRRISRTTPRGRILAIVLTLLAHGSAVLLIWGERRVQKEKPIAELQYVSLWPQVRVPRQSLPERELGRRRGQEPAVRDPSRSERTPPDVVTPVLVTEPLRADVIPAESSNSRAPVDWNAAAKDAAARIAGIASDQRSFSTAPQALRKPCKARVFDEDTKRLMDERLPPPADPDLLGADPKANCIVVGGYPKCVQKFKPKVRKRMVVGDFDKDTRAGKMSAPSVPSIEVCE
jgi:hypothetical protein